MAWHAGPPGIPPETLPHPPRRQGLAMFGPGLSVPAATIRALCTRVLGGTMYQPYPPPPPPPPTVRPPRWGRFIAWTAGAAVAAFAIGGGVAVLMDDDSSSSANPAVCKTALTAAYREAMAAGPDAPTAAAPPSCVGLDEAVLERITGEVIAEYLESPEAARVLERALESAAGTP